MVDLQLLQELVTFAQFGTLSATAEQLSMTQPSVTRGMKKLEQELGVTLFDRTANRITLNATGKLAARKAQELLARVAEFTTTITNYGQAQNTIKIGTVLPGPRLLVARLQSQLPAPVTLNPQLFQPDAVVPALNQHQEQIIFTTAEIFTDQVESRYLGVEQLAVMIDPFNPLSTHGPVTFADLAGQSFLALRTIGPWKKILETQIPQVNFLYQENLANLTELSSFSNFPYFVSNLTAGLPQERANDDPRVLVPITSPASRLEIFATYLSSQRAQLAPVLKQIATHWPQ